MIEVHRNLLVGGRTACSFKQHPDLAIVHACKYPCHRRAVGYRTTLPKDHPCYLVYESGHHLFLSMIDPPTPLFKLPVFTASLDFIGRHISTKRVLVHCNQGYSRAPGIALLFLAKRAGAIDDSSYAQAKAAFRQLYPLYKPGRGLEQFLRAHWTAIH